MAAPAIDQRQIDAGFEFDKTLTELGLDANGVLWAFDRDLDHHVLVVITDFFDFKGPLEISKALFAAYNAAILPKEIDPFIVQLYSTRQPFARNLLDFAGNRADYVDEETGEKKPLDDLIELGVGSLAFKQNWVIKRLIKSDRKSAELSRRWKRFEANVEKIAA
jgi:hypothetical protein